MYANLCTLQANPFESTGLFVFIESFGGNFGDVAVAGFSLPFLVLSPDYHGRAIRSSTCKTPKRIISADVICNKGIVSLVEFFFN